MRQVLLAVTIAVALFSSTSAEAKKKKKPPAATAPDVSKSKKEAPTTPPPGDPRTNEGARGRTNATEDESKAGDSPAFEHRP